MKKIFFLLLLILIKNIKTINIEYANCQSTKPAWVATQQASEKSEKKDKSPIKPINKINTEVKKFSKKVFHWCWILVNISVLYMILKHGLYNPTKEKIIALYYYYKKAQLPTFIKDNIYGDIYKGHFIPEE